jgi:hypothetical protein
MLPGIGPSICPMLMNAVIVAVSALANGALDPIF